MATVDYALTTLSRVKDRLQVDNNNHDAFLEQLINTATSLIERYCSRRFQETTYTNQVYTIDGNRNNQLVLKQAPVKSITSIERRLGSPDNPNWDAMLTNNYILEEDGDAGIVNLLGGVTIARSALRVTYTAGFKFDFPNSGDSDKHELPHDITDACERIVGRLFKNRDNDHMSQENIEGSSATFKTTLQDIDKEILDKYVRLRTV
jgi:uncharacterized phiE125 gp8 family phage protein